MHDDEIRAIKAGVLRQTAEEFRRAAASGEDPQANLLAAALLERRAERIAAGEDDHSSILLPNDAPADAEGPRGATPDERSEDTAD
ncbi:MAG: hypothetical protein P0Y60_11320 [Candidatus Microbacterium colombiense]|nr:MAG: hypothetical protein P0Y60_11320 [Microbacterium sp.]